MDASVSRRQFVAAAAGALGAPSILSQYHALAAPLARQVKITDIKVMLVQGLFDWPMVKIETDGGVTGIGESYWGRGGKDIMLGYLRPLLIGEDPLDVARKILGVPVCKLLVPQQRYEEAADDSFHLQG